MNVSFLPASGTDVARMEVLTTVLEGLLFVALAKHSGIFMN